MNAWKRRLINSCYRVVRMSTMAEGVPPKFKDYFHETGRFDNPSVISLEMGTPTHKMLKECVKIFQKATHHRLEHEEDGDLFQYGPTLGDWNFRYNLAKFLTENYKEDVNMKNLMATTGASHGLHFTTGIFFKKGDTVFVEDPTYFIAIETLTRDLQSNVVSVPMDSEGIDVKKLEENIEKHLKPVKSSSFYDAMMYLIPAHQNPTGICYSEDRCKELIKIAKKRNLLIICDDVYNLLSYGNQNSVKPLFYYDNQDDPRVISNGTFSKLLGPGIRLGWIQASEKILFTLKNTGVVKSGGGCNNYTSGIVSSVIELGLLNEILPVCREDYGKRLSTICQILKQNLPKTCKFIEPTGGFFIWIILPPKTNAEDVAKYCKDNFNVTPLAGNRCSAANNFQNCLRLAFSTHEEQIVFESVERLCKAITEFLLRN